MPENESAESFYRKAQEAKGDMYLYAHYLELTYDAAQDEVKRLREQLEAALCPVRDPFEGTEQEVAEEYRAFKKALEDAQGEAVEGKENE